ncbi:MAG: hypothetical protein QOE48_3721, partial [Mycobacterium sp.]|nr:hypothetical protein [Mycobacterium sp.]
PLADSIKIDVGSSAWSGRLVAAAVPWWNGYTRAGGHRLFTANDREPTGIARSVSWVEIANTVVAQ